jgi:hypothetical protein
VGCALYVNVVCLNRIGLSPHAHVWSTALGKALAADKRQLVYGGGSKGIMGIVSGAVLGAGGDVVGVTPYAILAAGGETGDGSESPPLAKPEEGGRDRVSFVRFLYTSLVEPAPRWNRCGWPPPRLTILVFADFGLGRRELDARTESRDGATFVRFHWTSGWVWHV